MVPASYEAHCALIPCVGPSQKILHRERQFSPKSGESQRGLKRKGPKLLKTARKKNAEDMSEDFSKICSIRRYPFYWVLECFWISSTSSRRIAFFWEVFGSVYPLGFYPLAVSREFFWLKFQETPLGSWMSAPLGHGCPDSTPCFFKVSTALTLAAQTSYRKVAVTTVGRKQARSHSAAESQGFSLRRPQIKKSYPLATLGVSLKSQDAHSDHGRKSPQLRDFAAAATTGH